LAIAELVKEQVQILQLSRVADGGTEGRIVAIYPELDPRGLGYAAIVTSDMFGIASTLDQPTHLLLERQRAFAAKDVLTSNEQRILTDINLKLERLGFRFFHPDEEYSRYLRLRSEAMRSRFGTDDPEALASFSTSMDASAREDLGNRLITELLAEQSAKGAAAQ
jgi:hypothetical protein